MPRVGPTPMMRPTLPVSAPRDASSGMKTYAHTKPGKYDLVVSDEAGRKARRTLEVTSHAP